ncbi:DNA polymerase-3 subunit epsilon [Plasticicumulans lactativorans]|uniref:DNA polymerase III subunit epsilon n=1 Tax=Plasticicumulans lactativorans TaxID=1133106 RepID=A0A4R2LFJ5_9GAMM|nr:DNA polymerase III subunit epsilon [Plasticicumulans lactativorans]TCO83464.1 DNA polymerase-3 subunit epsilon [Plasticicumulans lactativorans]
MRQIVLDTETTGLEAAQGHRIIEIGCVELDNRRPTGRTFHHYLNPEREIDAGAVEVHGITSAFLADKPRFADVVDELLDFIGGAELVIHNAAFDVGFLDCELVRAGDRYGRVSDHCTVLDTLVLARTRHPGARNSLDALCKRYGVDNTRREFHGALLDARILADVYLAMTGGQVAMSLDVEPVVVDEPEQHPEEPLAPLSTDRPPLRIVHASAAELAAQQSLLALIDKACGGGALARQLDGAAASG